MISASLDSTKIPPQELLAHPAKGSLQPPDFQRGWVLDDERIRSLLASVSFPIGGVMLLQTGGEHVRFRPRPLAGTHLRLREISPETVILDGQQRLTSLYQALMSTSAVETKDAKSKPIRRWYYRDMKKAVANDDDREPGRVLGGLRLREALLQRKPWARRCRWPGAHRAPTDEPASRLLERIRAEREAKPAQASRTRRHTRATKERP